jgi:putative nucleotidyltransferase with HDIG domain
MISCSKSFQQNATPGLDAGLLWKHSVATAYAARFVAEAAHAADNMIFTAGLLHDIGKVVFIKAHPEQYVSLLKTAASAKTTSLELETARYGCHHGELGAALLERWKLPVDLVESVAFHHQPDKARESQQAATCVFLGNLIAHGEDYPPATDREDYKAAIGRLNLDAEDMACCQQQLREHRKIMEEMTSLQA